MGVKNVRAADSTACTWTTRSATTFKLSGLDNNALTDG